MTTMTSGGDPMRDPNIPLKLKAGCYARVFFPTLEPDTDPFRGDHLWLRVTDVNRVTGVVSGAIETAPRSRSGVTMGEVVTIAIDRVEDVVSVRPR